MNHLAWRVLLRTTPVGDFTMMPISQSSYWNHISRDVTRQCDLMKSPSPKNTSVYHWPQHPCTAQGCSQKGFLSLSPQHSTSPPQLLFDQWPFVSQRIIHHSWKIVAFLQSLILVLITSKNTFTVTLRMEFGQTAGHINLTSQIRHFFWYNQAGSIG